MEQKFYYCAHCKKMAVLTGCTGVSAHCCGEPMKQVEPNTTEASQEKHLPVVSVEGNRLEVSVGSAEHPMAQEHFIEWIFLQTENGGQWKRLSPNDKPHAVFTLENDKATAVLAYCNLHSLWKTSL